MGFYADHIEPRLIACTCGLKVITRERAGVVPRATGRVLEVGFGAGANAPFYDSARVKHLYALEPSAGMRRLGEKRLRELAFSSEWIDLPGEEIPLPEDSVDTVVVTFSLCTIPDVDRALQGMRRVLKPDGALVFVEHGLAPDPGVARWQNRLNGVWSRLGGGCNLNRDTRGMLRRNGFAIAEATSKYLKGSPKFAGYVTAGVATR